MRCRICSDDIEKPFLSLGNMPLSNSLVVYPYIEQENYYPLDIYLCKKCYFIQTPDFSLAKKIFSEGYPYFSSYSETWLHHCKNYVEMMIDKYKYNKNSTVIEIGSNDGALLQYFKNYDVNILGIEPVEIAANNAIKKNIPTNIKYFDKQYAHKILKDGVSADLIIGNNVLAHNPDLHNFVEGLKTILKPNGIITIEFPYLLNLIKQNQFDTIYHEHFSYFSLFSVRKLFQIHDMTIFNADEIPTHGGSIRIYIKHKNDNTKNNTLSNISDLIKRETELYSPATYIEFNNRIKLIKRELLKILINIKEGNKRIVAYGAPAKGNTLLNYCGIGTDFIDYAVDLNSYKQGKYLPGTHIPINHPNIINEDKPDYILILPWNIKDEIMHQLEYTKEWKCKFIIPIPVPYIIDTNNICI